MTGYVNVGHTLLLRLPRSVDRRRCYCRTFKATSACLAASSFASVLNGMMATPLISPLTDAV
jgi:hypothetical protein